jgi:hypothetical protein
MEALTATTATAPPRRGGCHGGLHVPKFMGQPPPESPPMTPRSLRAGFAALLPAAPLLVLATPAAAPAANTTVAKIGDGWKSIRIRRSSRPAA